MEPLVPYSNREINLMFGEQNLKLEGMSKDINSNHAETQKSLTAILAQTTKHNGRLSKLETKFLIVGVALAVLLITNGSDVIKLFGIIF